MRTSLKTRVKTSVWISLLKERHYSEGSDFLYLFRILLRERNAKLQIALERAIYGDLLPVLP